MRESKGEKKSRTIAWAEDSRTKTKRRGKYFSPARKEKNEMGGGGGGKS